MGVLYQKPPLPAPWMGKHLFERYTQLTETPAWKTYNNYVKH